MKKVLIYCITLVFLLTGLGFAGQKGNQGNQKQKYDNRYENDQRDVHRYKQKYSKKDNHKYKGYRDRYYDHRKYHPNHYKGHWRSWNDWERYHKEHRRSYKQQRYYRNNDQLYFEFETDEGRFVFSIGR